MAVDRQQPALGLIHQFDRGIGYAADPYRSALSRSGITPSMSREGDLSIFARTAVGQRFKWGLEPVIVERVFIAEVHYFEGAAH